MRLRILNRALTTKELPIFYRYLFDRSAFVGKGQVSADFFIFALLTGAREGEIAELEWGDVDGLEGNLGAATVIFRDTKTHDNRLIPIGPMLALLLKRRRDMRWKQEKYVFPSYSESGHFEEPKNLTYRFLKLHPGFKHFSIHDIRRTFASHGRTEVSDPLIISTLVGHDTKDNTTEKHYTIVGEEIGPVLRESIVAVEAALLKKCEHEKVLAEYNLLPRERLRVAAAEEGTKRGRSRPLKPAN